MGRGSYARLIFALIMLLAMATVPAFAQLQTGDLYGTVADEQGQPLPGVTITLTGVGAPQVQVTDEGGSFRFLNLYPGTYGVKAELQGFSEIEYPDINVRVGGRPELQITLNAAIADTITVTGESPLLDERRVNQGSNVSTVELDKVPTARDPWSLLSQAPGVLVDRINVGGNESGQQSSFLGMGATARDNTFAIDGVILTDMNAVGGSATYFDFGAFEEVQFTVSSTDVTIATSGVTINQVTKRGTNEWRGAGRFLRTDGEYQSDPFLPNGNRIDSVEEYGADIGGPLWKDHLWIWAAYGESDINNLVPSPEDERGDPASQLDRTKLEDLNTKLNFQAGASNSGVLHYWTNDKLKFGRGAALNRAPETTWNQTTPQDIYKVEDTWIATPDLVVTGLASRDDGIFTLAPQGGLDADIFVDSSGVRRGTWLDFRQDAIIDQFRLDANYFFDAASADHQLKFGGSYRTQENQSTTAWPGGKLVWAGNLFGLGPGEAAVGFQRDRVIAIDSTYEAAWLQDTITRDRWTINAGLRYDNQYLENKAVSGPGNPEAPPAEEGGAPLIPSITFPGNDAGGFEWTTVSPRVGITYALGQERNSLLRATFSRYAEQLGQLPLANRVSPLGYSYTYFYFVDANNNLLLDDSERSSLQFGYAVGIDPSNPSSLTSPNVNDPDLGPAITDELTFGYERSFGANFASGLTLTYRNVHDIPEIRTLVLDETTGQTRLATRDDYEISPTISGCVPPEPDPELPPEEQIGPCTLPNGQVVAPFPVYDLRPGLSSTGGFYTNGDREQDYLGATLSFNRRLANRWSLRGHLTYADWDWTIGDEFKRYDDPNDIVADDLGFSDDEDLYLEQGGTGKGNSFINSRWNFNVAGVYQIAPERPWGFSLAASVTGREGYATPASASVGSEAGLGQRGIQLTDDLDEFRTPDIYLLDARIDKDFQFGDFTLNVGLDGFNLTNETYVLQRDRDAFAAQGVRHQITEVLSPRVFRLGATLRFR